MLRSRVMTEGVIAKSLSETRKILGIQHDADSVCESCSALIEGSDEECLCLSDYPYKPMEIEKHGKPVKITFYRDYDPSPGEEKMEVAVERTKTVGDLCSDLAAIMQLRYAAYWTLVEYWADKGAERQLEEHELMVEVYKETLKFKRTAKIRYIFKQQTHKFQFLEHPFDIRTKGGIVSEDKEMWKDEYHLVCDVERLVDKSLCPVFFSRTYLLYHKSYIASFILLKDGVLYFTDNRDGQMKLMEMQDITLRAHYGAEELDLTEIPGLVRIGNLSDYQIYQLRDKFNPVIQDTNGKIQTNSFLLRPTSAPAVRRNRRRDNNSGIPSIPKRIVRCCSALDGFAVTWIGLMRLAKYGKQLRENYRAFKNKQETPAREFGRATVPNQQGSPLFPRIGCLKHLKERYTPRDNQNLVNTLFRSDTGVQVLGEELTGYGNRNSRDTFFPLRPGENTRRITTRERLEREREAPVRTCLMACLRWWFPCQCCYRCCDRDSEEEPRPRNRDAELTYRFEQAGTSNQDTPNTETREEQGRRLGAIRKIFTPKSKKGRKKHEDIELPVRSSEKYSDYSMKTINQTPESTPSQCETPFDSEAGAGTSSQTDAEIQNPDVAASSSRARPLLTTADVHETQEEEGAAAAAVPTGNIPFIIMRDGVSIPPGEPVRHDDLYVMPMDVVMKLTEK